MDTLEGDSEGHVRFKTPEEAQAVVKDRSAVAKEHGWTLDLLSGENRFLRDLSVPSKTHHSHVYVLALMFFVISLGDHE